MIDIDELRREWNACYGIEWALNGSLLKPLHSVGDCSYLDESQIARFRPGDGLVGKAFEQRMTLFLPSTRDADTDFVRKASAVADGIHSIVFLWSEDRLLELGFQFELSEAPQLHVTHKDSGGNEAPGDADGLCFAVSRLVGVFASLSECLPCLRPLRPDPVDFTPEAHREAFLDTSRTGKDDRKPEQMADRLPPSNRVFFEMEEVTRHSHADDGWLVVHNNVYNITNFIKHHPGWFYGGQSSTVLAIVGNLGKECSVIFDAIHPNHAIRQLSEYRIGELPPIASAVCTH